MFSFRGSECAVRAFDPRSVRDESGAERLGQSVKIIPLTRFRVSVAFSGLVVTE